MTGNYSRAARHIRRIISEVAGAKQHQIQVQQRWTQNDLVVHISARAVFGVVAVEIRKLLIFKIEIRDIILKVRQHGAVVSDQRHTVGGDRHIDLDGFRRRLVIAVLRRIAALTLLHRDRDGMRRGNRRVALAGRFELNIDRPGVRTCEVEIHRAAVFLVRRDLCLRSVIAGQRIGQLVSLAVNEHVRELHLQQRSLRRLQRLRRTVCNRDLALVRRKCTERHARQHSCQKCKHEQQTQYLLVFHSFCFLSFFTQNALRLTFRPVLPRACSAVWQNLWLFQSVRSSFETQMHFLYDFIRGYTRGHSKLNAFSDLLHADGHARLHDHAHLSVSKTSEQLQQSRLLRIRHNGLLFLRIHLPSCTKKLRRYFYRRSRLFPATHAKDTFPAGRGAMRSFHHQVFWLVYLGAAHAALRLPAYLLMLSQHNGRFSPRRTVSYTYS